MPELDHTPSAFQTWTPNSWSGRLSTWSGCSSGSHGSTPQAISSQKASEHTEGSFANRAVIAQTPEGKVRAWVDANYTLVPLKEKDSGTKLDALFGAYTTASPPVHAKPLGKILFTKMLNAVCAGVGPHRNSTGSAQHLLASVSFRNSACKAGLRSRVSEPHTVNFKYFFTFSKKVEGTRRAEFRKRPTELAARVAREEQALPRDVVRAVGERDRGREERRALAPREVPRAELALHERRGSVRDVDAGVGFR